MTSTEAKSDTAKAEPLAPTFEGVRAQWDAFAQVYTNYLELTTLNLGRYVHQCLKLGSAKQVLEVGCGPGRLAKELAAQLPAGARYVCTDYAPLMVEAAKKNLAEFESVEVKEGNACDLKEYKDGSFDRYVANLTVHLVPDPDAQLREAARVLAPGGIAAFSVWGLSGTHSPMFTLLPSAQAKLGIGQGAGGPSVRSNFHLGQDDPALRERVRKAGFDGTVVSFHAPVIAEAVDADEWTRNAFTGPSSVKLLSEIKPELKEKFIATVRQMAHEVIDSGRPILMDAVIVIASRAAADKAAAASGSASS